MITKFSQYYKIQEGSDDPNSFEVMMKNASIVFFDDVKDQLLRYVDRIVSESKYKSLFNPSSYFVVFEYKGHLFKMDFTTGGFSVQSYYVETPPSSGFYYPDTKRSSVLVNGKYTRQGDDSVYISMGSMSQSMSIMFNKIDKFIKKLK